MIVPDDVLWELPFHTLVGQGGRYVLEDAAVAYAPSLTTLREMTALARRRASEPAAVESSPWGIRHRPKDRPCRTPRAR